MNFTQRYARDHAAKLERAWLTQHKKPRKEHLKPQTKAKSGKTADSGNPLGSPNPELDSAKIEDSIRRCLKAGAWVSRSALYKALHADRYGISAFLSSLGTLVGLGEIERDKKKNGEYYRLRTENNQCT